MSKDKLVKGFSSFVKGEKPAKELMEIYAYFGYIKKGRPCVPIYEMDKIMPVLEEMYRYIVDLAGDELQNAIKKMQEYDLTPMLHAVETGKTANEVYHCIFGFINRYCVKAGMVAKPRHRFLEGRYLKSFEQYKE